VATPPANRPAIWVAAAARCGRRRLRFGPRIAAVWLDKRDFLSGYDVYAALTEPGSLRFAKDAKAQDSFGDAIAQWHAAVAGNARGELVIAWDDDRDGIDGYLADPADRCRLWRKLHTARHLWTRPAERSGDCAG
jgi:hypothetical protein